MQRKSIYIILVAFVLSLISSEALAKDKFGLKLYGGWAYLRAGDINAATRDLFNWAKDNLLVGIPGPTDLSSGGVRALHSGSEVGGDVIFEFSRIFGVGIGSGYLQASRISKGGISVADPASQVGAWVNAFPKLSATPIRAGLFLTLPLSGRINVIGDAGVSYYFMAKCKAGWLVGTDFADALGPANQVSTLAEKKKNAFGFQGGVGVEYMLSPRIAILVEAQGRHAKFRGLSGSTVTEATTPGHPDGVFPPFSESGKLYYESVPMIPGSPRLIMVQNAPPAGPGGVPREAVVDFSGVTLQAGVRIHF